MLKKWIPIWAVPTLLLFAVGTVWLRLTIVRTTYAINQAERDIAKSHQDKEKYQLKVAALRSPKRLEVLARTQFGLVQPRMEQVVHFRKAEILGHDP